MSGTFSPRTGLPARSSGPSHGCPDPKGPSQLDHGKGVALAVLEKGGVNARLLGGIHVLYGHPVEPENVSGERAVGSGRKPILLDGDDGPLYLSSRFSVQTVSPFSQRREEPSLAAFFWSPARNRIKADGKRPNRMLKNPFSPRLLKKVQMQGGARCEVRGVLSRYAAASRECANAADGSFSAAC